MADRSFEELYRFMLDHELCEGDVESDAQPDAHEPTITARWSSCGARLTVTVDPSGDVDISDTVASHLIEYSSLSLDQLVALNEDELTALMVKATEAVPELHESAMRQYLNALAAARKH